MANATTTTPNIGTWTKRHIIDSASLTPQEINTILSEARILSEIQSRPIKKVPLLEGKVVVNVFFENSTRTRTSFEIAAKYLGADVVNFDIATSSVKKGETLTDTIDTLIALGADALVVRHSSSGVCKMLERHVNNRVAILNAGDGNHDHPSQGLLDLYTLLDRKQTVADKKIVIIGDILHSRVARSNLHILNKMGADMHVVAPPTLLPADINKLNCQVHTHLETALKDADAVMCLRLQLERQTSGLVPSLSSYAKNYGLNRERLAFAKSDVLVMHQGPMNRSVEIMSDVADDPKYSVISEMVTNGVSVRMALLRLTIMGEQLKGGLP